MLQFIESYIYKSKCVMRTKQENYQILSIAEDVIVMLNGTILRERKVKN